MEEQGQSMGQPQPGDILSTITTAFNLGVAARQQGENRSVTEVVSELRNTIYNNISSAYGSSVNEDYLNANVEYLLQISLLGFIIPSLCAYDEEFKNRLFTLIMAKLDQVKHQQPQSKDDKIIIT